MMRIQRSFLFILLLGLLLAGGGPARAQDEIFLNKDSGKVKTMTPADQKRIMLLNAAKEAKMLQQRPQGPIRQVETKPIVNARGEQLVGIIDQRTMTKNQLATRVNLILQHLPDIQDPDEKARAAKLLDRRVNLEGRILDEWEHATVLAVTAAKMGYQATAQEVEQAIQNLSAQNAANSGQPVQQTVRMIGIPEADLRQEVEDGIIVEKMLREQIDKVPEEGLKQVFDKEPQVFLEPTRVKAWELVATMLNSPTDDDLKQTKKVITALAKRLGKCKTQADYLALQKELAEDRDAMLRKLNGQTDLKVIKQSLGQYKGILLVYLDDVASTGYRFYREPVRPEVSKDLFGLKPGKMSGVIASPAAPRKTTEYHVVKVLERTEGHKGTFEEAKPQIKSLMIEKLKDVVYQNVLNQGQSDIRTDPAGLNDFIEIGHAAAATPTPAPDSAPVLGAGAGAPAGAMRNPYQPAQVSRSIFDKPLPSVESVVGSKAEVVAPGTALALTPEASARTLGGNRTTSGTAPTGLGAPAPGLVAAPAAPASPQPNPTPTTRRRGNRPAPNFNAVPPPVDEVLSREERARVR